MLRVSSSEKAFRGRKIRVRENVRERERERRNEGEIKSFHLLVQHPAHRNLT